MATATDVQEEFLACRTLSHAWTYAEVTREGRRYVQTYRCTRCNCQRWVKISSQGELEGSGYRYPKGYALTDGGLQGRERGKLRLRAVRYFSELSAPQSRAS